MITAIVAMMFFGISALCALVIWAACAVGARADRSAWRAELEAQWPSMPKLEGNDLFLEQCGPPTGQIEEP